MSDDKRVISKISDIACLSVRRREAPGRLVSNGNDGYGDRTYQSNESGKGGYDIVDFHISGKGIHKVEKHHTTEFQNIEGERGHNKWKESMRMM